MSGRKTPIRFKQCSGQALVEFALISVLLLSLLFGLIDFGRAILVRQVMVNLSREGANLASRGTSFADTLNALVASAHPLVIDQKGFLILTTVSRDNDGNLTITAQQSRGGTSVSSKVGQIGGGGVTLPNNSVPAPNQTLTVSEVFYTYEAWTPIGKLVGSSMPTTLYDAAYF